MRTLLSPTDQALRAFDGFLSDWIPTAVHEQVFGHTAHAAEGVRRAIRGIVDQRALLLRPEPLGYGVFRQDTVPRSRDYQQGVMYVAVSPVFEHAYQGVNSVDGFNRRHPGYHVLGELREYLT